MVSVLGNLVCLLLLGSQSAAFYAGNFPFPSLQPVLNTVRGKDVATNTTAAKNVTTARSNSLPSLPELIDKEAGAVKASADALDEFKAASRAYEALVKEKEAAMNSQTLAKKHADAAQAKLKVSQQARVEAAKMDVSNVPASSQKPSESHLNSAQEKVDEAEQEYLTATAEKKSADAAVKAAVSKEDAARKAKNELAKQLAHVHHQAELMANSVRAELAKANREADKHVSAIAEIRKQKAKLDDGPRVAANNSKA